MKKIESARGKLKNFYLSHFIGLALQAAVNLA